MIVRVCEGVIVDRAKLFEANRSECMVTRRILELPPTSFGQQCPPKSLLIHFSVFV